MKCHSYYDYNKIVDGLSFQEKSDSIQADTYCY